MDVETTESKAAIDIIKHELVSWYFEHRQERLVFILNTLTLVCSFLVLLTKHEWIFRRPEHAESNTPLADSNTPRFEKNTIMMVFFGSTAAFSIYLQTMTTSRNYVNKSNQTAKTASKLREFLRSRKFKPSQHVGDEVTDWYKNILYPSKRYIPPIINEAFGHEALLILNLPGTSVSETSCNLSRNISGSNWFPIFLARAVKAGRKAVRLFFGVDAS